MRLEYAAISDVGRVRKDNQDSGYAGPHVLAVCDGVGGAARGDIASATAIGQLRRLDDGPALGEDQADLLGQVAGALHRAHDRIGDLVDENPALTGTSTTATVALFDGTTLAMGHVGDSRAYLLRDGELRQLTQDHTFVQTLIDDGQITEEEARDHPHRNLILKAIDGIHDLEPDLFTVDVTPGDRLLFCSDGACGVLEPDRLADILGSGQRRLRGGRAGPGQPRRRQHRQRHLPGRRHRRGRRRHRGRDRTGRRRRRAAPQGPRRRERASSAATAPATPASSSRCRPRSPTTSASPSRPTRSTPRRRATRRGRPAASRGYAGSSRCSCWSAWSGSAAQPHGPGPSSSTTSASTTAVVTIYRGVNADLPGVALSTPYETTRPGDGLAERVRPRPGEEGIGAGDLASARRTVDNLVAEDAAGSAGG